MSGVRRKITEISVFEFLYVCQSSLFTCCRRELTASLNGVRRQLSFSLTRLISFAVPGLFLLVQ